MPRRGRSSPMRAAPRPAPRPVSHVPARAPQHQPMQTAQAPPPMMAQKQPGMFAQMATTAAGVAVGSAVGHTLGHAMTSGGNSAPQEVAESQPAQMAPGQASGSACQFEFKQFMECTQNQSDISLCQGFNEVFRQCQQSNGLAPQSNY